MSVTQRETTVITITAKANQQGQREVGHMNNVPDETDIKTIIHIFVIKPFS